MRDLRRKGETYVVVDLFFVRVFYAYIKRKACLLSAKKKIARNHRERSRLFLLLLCACVTPIDATAAGMNLKQFNFYSTRQVNCLLVEKRQPGLGFTNTSKKEEKKREKEKREADILRHKCTTKMFLSTNRRPRRSETKFSQLERKLYSFTQKMGKGRQKRERVSVSFSF